MGYKVIQWATGSMGKTCLRAVIDHPSLDLVGLLVYGESKSGRDAGDIARRDVTGVKATRRLDEILSLDADVVLHCPRIQPPYAHHNRDLCQLLASGKNVISINGHTYPRYWGTEYMDEINEACAKGGSTLFGTGLNPGFITEKIAAAATGLCTRIDRIHVSEIVDCTSIPNPDYVFDVLGFGANLNEVDLNESSWPPAELMTGMYSEVVAQLVDRLGLTLDHVASDHEVFPATRDIDMAAGRIKKGTVSVTHWRWHGMVKGKRFFTLSIRWIMEDAHLREKDYNLWDVKIRGIPGVEISVNLMKPEDTGYRTMPEQYALAGSVINSIPAVCAAPPGVLRIPLFAPYRPRFTKQVITSSAPTPDDGSSKTA
jgi:2,4-diaminopentanoate dehydrogenase